MAGRVSALLEKHRRIVDQKGMLTWSHLYLLGNQPDWLCDFSAASSVPWGLACRRQVTGLIWERYQDRYFSSLNFNLYSILIYAFETITFFLNTVLLYLQIFIHSAFVITQFKIYSNFYCNIILNHELFRSVFSKFPNIEIS